MNFIEQAVSMNTIPNRIVIYARDIMNITGRRERTAHKMLSAIPQKIQQTQRCLRHHRRILPVHRPSRRPHPSLPSLTSDLNCLLNQNPIRFAGRRCNAANLIGLSTTIFENNDLFNLSYSCHPQERGS
jgi:hypothetical protein